MTILNKVKWFLSLAIIFTLLIATNLIDRRHFQRLETSVTNIYEDRLLAKDVIYKMSILISEEELALSLQDTTVVNYQPIKTDSIQSLITTYISRKPPKDELEYLDLLNSDLEQLKSLESKIEDKALGKRQLMAQLSEMKAHLNALAAIQIDEGHRQQTIATDSLQMLELFTWMEIGFIAVIALFMGIFVFYRPSENKATE